MTSLCKWMAAEAGLRPELGQRILDLGDELQANPVDAVIHTAPVPQALATLSFGGLLPDPELAGRLAGIRYKPTIAVLLAPTVDPTGLPSHGGRQFLDHPDLAFVADNRAKGVSSRPAVTIHLSNELSGALWAAPDDEIVSRALELTAADLGAAADPAVSTRARSNDGATPARSRCGPTRRWCGEPSPASRWRVRRSPAPRSRARSCRGAPRPTC